MRLFILLVTLSIFLYLPCLIRSSQFIVDGTVLELTDSNFDEAISSFDYIFVDFYAPWCGHCKRLAPELDKAAPVLAQLKKPILIAKVNADKYSRLATKYDIDGFPSLKIFRHGVPTNYYGSREADLLVRFLKKFVAPDVAILSSDADIREFIEDAGHNFPVFIGYGLNESVITNMAVKYKKKAWFSVAKGFSEEVMVLHDFDKVPSLISLHPTYDERNVFYGPFEEAFLEDFIRQNMFPIIVPINDETLKQLKDDERKIVVTIMDDTKEEKSKRLTETLKAAASANRDFIFGYVGVKQYPEFAQSFEVTKNTKLPKMVVWDGKEVYFSVVGSESIDEEDERSQVSRFLERYNEGNVTEKQISGPSFITSNMNWVIGIAIVYIFGSAFLIFMLIRTIKKEDQALIDGTTREQADHLNRNTTNSEEEIRSNEIPSRSGKKED